MTKMREVGLISPRVKKLLESHKKRGKLGEENEEMGASKKKKFQQKMKKFRVILKSLC